MTRRYDSPLREDAARATRFRVVEAARELFLERGYAATTVRQVAAAAGVSEQTVYARMGGKAGLLKSVYDVTLAGDDEPAPMAERPEFRRLRDAPDGRSLLAAYADIAVALDVRLRPLLEQVHGARAVEPDLDALARTGAAERRSGSRMFAQHAVARGLVRADLEFDEVVDLVWVLNAPEVYLLHVRDGGRSDDEFRSWLIRALEIALLPQ